MPVPHVDHDRRKFLKLAAFGGATFFAGRFLGNLYDHLSSYPSKVVFFRNFKVTESNKQLGVYDSSGDEILLIDRED